MLLLMCAGLSKSHASSLSDSEMESGDRVIVAGQRKGTIRFIGETQFAPGAYVCFLPLFSLCKDRFFIVFMGKKGKRLTITL